MQNDRQNSYSAAQPQTSKPGHDTAQGEAAVRAHEPAMPAPGVNGHEIRRDMIMEIRDYITWLLDRRAASRAPDGKDKR